MALIGFGVEKVRQDGSYEIVRLFILPSPNYVSQYRQSAKKYADKVNGWVTPIGELTEAEMERELLAGKKETKKFYETKARAKRKIPTQPTFIKNFSRIRKYEKR